MASPGPSVDQLIDLIERQRTLLIEVATGTTITETSNVEYSERRRQIVPSLMRLKLEDPFPWRDLWRWYGFYKDDYPTYQSRRDLIHERADPVLHALEQRSAAGLEDLSVGSAWSDLELRLDGLKSEFDAASTLDDLQDVGRRSREILIDAANLAFSDSMVPGGSEVPSRSDAKRRIDYFLAEVASGESMEALRRVVRTCHDLNNAVTHSSSTTRPMALAAAQATILVVRTLEELWNESEPF